MYWMPSLRCTCKCLLCIPLPTYFSPWFPLPFLIPTSTPPPKKILANTSFPLTIESSHQTPTLKTTPSPLPSSSPKITASSPLAPKTVPLCLSPLSFSKVPLVTSRLCFGVGVDRSLLRIRLLLVRHLLVLVVRD
jgi:hypothetical protein